MRGNFLPRSRRAAEEVKIASFPSDNAWDITWVTRACLKLSEFHAQSMRSDYLREVRACDCG